MTAGRPRARRSLAATALTSVLVAVLCATGGCEFAIGDTVPSFYCNGGPNPCPAGQVCDMNLHDCVPDCNKAGGCSAGKVCSPSGVCVSGMDGGGMPEVGVNETSDEDAADVVDSMMSEEEASPPPDTGGNETTNPCPSTGAGILCGCSGASSCTSGMCADSLAVGAALYGAAGMKSFCTQACCTSSDCPTPTVCYATGQGGNYCVDPAWLGRAIPAGNTTGGGGCSRNADCRSGLCTSNFCVDTCCSTPNGSTDCSGGDVCQIGPFPGTGSVDQNYGAFCAFGGGSGQDGMSCSSVDGSMCQSKLCAQFMGESSPHCRDACSSNADCTNGDACSYVISSQMTSPTPIVAACAPPAGTVAMGTSCDMTTNCQGFCDPNDSKCTAPCFSDADCSGGWHCRIELISLSSQGGGSYDVLVCAP
jgi:hypothetical protein